MKAVIFDRDGVIIDSESTNINSAINAFKELEIEINEDEHKWIVGKHPDDYKHLFLEKYDFSYDDFREIQRKHYYLLLESTPFFDKTIKLIKLLHSEGITLALNISSSRQMTLEIIKRAGLDGVFKEVVTFGDYSKRKPDPESYLLTAKKLGLKPKDCVVIEDSEVGVIAAKDAGMKCIALPNKYTKTQNLSRADIILDSPEKITLDLLNSL